MRMEWALIISNSDGTRRNSEGIPGRQSGPSKGKKQCG